MRVAMAMLVAAGLGGLASGCDDGAGGGPDGSNGPSPRSDADATGDVGDAPETTEDDGSSACVDGVCAAGPDHAPDPAEWGPFPVGVRTFDLDVAAATSESTRELTVELWYPAIEEARGAPKDTIDLVAEAPDAVHEQYDDLPPLEFEVRQVRGAPMRRDDGPYPLVLFSHGSYGIRFQSVFWTLYLASHGYVVAAPDHPGNTLYEALLEGVGDANEVFVEGIEERPNDVLALLDHLVDRAGDEADPLHGVLDPERVAVSGHSFGGYTSIVAALEDERIDAIVPMAPMTVAIEIQGYELANLPVPVMMMAGAEDRTLEPDTEMLGPWKDMPPPRYYLELADAGHFTFSDVCELDLQGLNEQYDLGLGNILTDGCGEENVPLPQAHPLIRRFGIGFLNHRLRGSAGSRAFYRDVPEGTADEALELRVREP